MKLIEDEPPESFPPDDGNRETLGFVLGLLGVGAVIGAGVLYVILSLWGR